jgi:hypothetical protein
VRMFPMRTALLEVAVQLMEFWLIPSDDPGYVPAVVRLTIRSNASPE